MNKKTPALVISLKDLHDLFFARFTGKHKAGNLVPIKDQYFFRAVSFSGTTPRTSDSN